MIWALSQPRRAKKLSCRVVVRMDCYSAPSAVLTDGSFGCSFPQRVSVWLSEMIRLISLLKDRLANRRPPQALVDHRPSTCWGLWPVGWRILKADKRNNIFSDRVDPIWILDLENTIGVCNSIFQFQLKFDFQILFLWSSGTIKGTLIDSLKDRINPEWNYSIITTT